ncbi:type IV pilin protein [Halioglobus sp. HI00S01]|uniref:type IV pilin protein n=1 Tax=Halioglobus sp. HI00S01 TaxID=1822214 RepID=UPI001E598D4D|nr:type IV pilin protein [Halioglobus sp. HI00S01]
MPAYQDSVIKSRRSTAQSDLIGFAQAMEREFSAKFTYANAVAGTVYPDTSPTDGDTAFYNLSIQAVTANTYTLRATPTGSQSGDGIIELTNLGAKRWDRNNDGIFSAAENTWER